MAVFIPDEIIKATHMTESELLQEMSVILYQKEKLTLGQASKLANMNQLQFQHILASRDISLHYGVEDFEHDIKTLKEMGDL